MMDNAKAYLGLVLSLVFGCLLVLQTVRLDLTERNLVRVSDTLDQERALAQAALTVSTIAARETELGLGVSAALTRKETNDQVEALSRQRDDLLKRLRNAESKAATAVVVSKATAVACTGEAPRVGDPAELPATIGRADVEEASRADTIRLHLAACYRQYDEARQALSK